MLWGAAVAARHDEPFPHASKRGKYIYIYIYWEVTCIGWGSSPHSLGEVCMLPQNICSRVLRILPFDPSNMAVVVADGRGADVGFPRLPPPVARDDWKSVRFLVATFITFWSLVIFRERFCFATSIYFFFCGHMDFNNEPVHG